MGRRRGARIDVERHAEPSERLFDQLVVAVDDLLGRDPLLAGLDGDGHAVLVRSADRNHVAAPQPQIARVDVRRYVDARQMADMHGTVGIGQRRSDEITFVRFCHSESSNDKFSQKYEFFAEKESPDAYFGCDPAAGPKKRDPGRDRASHGSARGAGHFTMSSSSSSHPAPANLSIVKST